MHRRRFIASLITTLLLFAAWMPAVGAAAEETVTLRVDNMTCAMCPVTVRKALERVEGVQSAKVDFESKIATVIYDPERATVSDLTAATTNAGYPSKRKE
ncbi:Periplasmic mercury ion-binding protein [Salinisphaera sp. PC39]|uniref:mercury resistance system periplasmic binding protein MerP n=1 Tax=Salinisphaera sp. PC39 TaxID=1304156 RepID=UPI003340C950